MRAKPALASSPNQKSAGVSLEQNPFQAFGDLGSKLCHQKKTKTYYEFCQYLYINSFKESYFIS